MKIVILLVVLIGLCAVDAGKSKFKKGRKGKGPLNAMLKKADADGDGAVSLTELESYHAAAATAENLKDKVKDKLKALDPKTADQDGNDVITKEELRSWLWPGAYDHADSDNNGEVSVAELKQFHDSPPAELKSKVKARLAERKPDDADKDGNGVISKQEFRSWLWPGPYDSADTDDNDEVSMEELKTFYDKLPAKRKGKLNPEDADKDGNNIVTREEFRDWLRPKGGSLKKDKKKLKRKIQKKLKKAMKKIKKAGKPKRRRDKKQ